MNPLVLAAVSLLVRLILGSSVFARIEKVVARWAQEEISGAEKRDGVMAELEIIGIRMAEWAIRMAIELAVGKMKNYETKSQVTQ